MADYSITRGWTAAVDFQLLNAGSAYNLGSATVTLILKRQFDGTAVTTTSDLAVVTASEGRVRWTPDTDDLAAGSYTLRFQVTDGSDVSFFPSGAADTLTVYQQ